MYFLTPVLYVWKLLCFAEASSRKQQMQVILHAQCPQNYYFLLSAVDTCTYVKDHLVACDSKTHRVS